MKILHIAQIGSISEGIGSTLNSMVELQVSLGCDVKVVSCFENKIYKNLSITTINSSEEFCNFVDKWSPDVVLFHGVFFYKYSVYAKKLKNKGIPYAVQLHGALSEYNLNKNRLKKLLAIFLFIGEFIRNATSIIYLSEDELSRSVVPKINSSYKIVPNGCLVSNDIFYKERNKVIEIVFIGRIDYIGKGLDLLLKGVELIKDNLIIPFHISLYGTGPKSDIKKLNSTIKSISNIVTYKGGIFGEEKEKVLKNSDIFILTSRSEGMPMGVLEALSYGLPCIVSPETNMANLIINHDAGWSVELNSQDIMNTIKIALRDYMSNCEELHRNAYSLAKELSWYNSAKKSIDVLREVANSVKKV